MPLKETRAWFKELKQIEKCIKGQENLRGWLAYTRIENTHIVHALRKLGAKPYDIDEEKIWFKKKI